MVCREYGLSSVVIGQIRTTSWMDDAQIQSIYHLALHDPVRVGGLTHSWDRDALVVDVVTTARRDATYNPVYRPQRREGLLRRIEEGYSRAVESMPVERLAALSRLRTAVRIAEQQTRIRLRYIAGRRGMSEREAMAEFHQLRSQAPSGRQARATDEERADFGAIPVDPSTRYALTTMEAREARRPPQRAVNRWVSVQSGGGSNPIVEVGFSDSSDRVEIRYQDQTVVTREIPRERSHDFVQEAGRRRPTQEMAAELSAFPAGPPDRRDGREAGAYLLRCDDCGQFVGTRPHECVAAALVSMVSTQALVDGSTLSMPPTTNILLTHRQSEGREFIQIPIRHENLSDGHSLGSVSGVVTVRPQGTAVTTGRPQVLDLDDVGDELRCTLCGSTRCEHTHATREMVRRQLYEAGLMPTLQEHDESLPSPESLAPQHASSPTVEVSQRLLFSEDAEVFRAAARLGHAEGVPLLSHPFSGHAAGCSIGVELEYSGGQTEGVGPALHAAGIISQPEMSPYHSGSHISNRWRFERDVSVTGELISPAFTDSEEAWQEMARACASIRDNGGETHFAGSHTNIGCPDYGLADAWRLAHLVRGHEEDLMRMGRTRGSRRQSSYTPPVPPLSETPWTRDWDAARLGRGMVNFAHAFLGNERQRIEFRFPDASHDAGVIQAQARLCAGMVNFARTDSVRIGEHRPQGQARQLGRANAMTLNEAEFTDQTASIRGLIDSVVSTDEERMQLARLWGRGNFYR